MAIYFHTGVLGAGKSYGATYIIAKDYCIKKDGKYILKDGILLITNIRGLKLDHISLDDLVEQIPGDSFRDKILAFFDFDFQQEFLKEHYGEYQVLYFIDEAADYFSPEYLTGRDAEGLKKFFRRCRHLGCDIFIIAQDKTQVHRSIVQLAEYESRAMPRVLSFGPFHYQYRVGRAKIKTRFFFKKKDIFALYTSQDKKESSKISNPFIPVFIILGIVFAAYLWKASHLYSRSSSREVSSDSVLQSSSQVSAAQPSSQVPAAQPSSQVPSGKSFLSRVEPEYIEKRMRLSEFWVGEFVLLYDLDTASFYFFKDFPKKVEVVLDPISKKYRYYSVYNVLVERDQQSNLPRRDDSFTNKYIGGTLYEHHTSGSGQQSFGSGQQSFGTGVRGEGT